MPIPMHDCRIVAAASLFPKADEPLLGFLPPAAPSARSAQLLRMDRLCGLALVAADQAVAAAPSGYGLDPASTAVVVCSAYGCHKTDEDYFRGVLTGQPSPRLFAYTLPSSPVGEVSIQYGLLGSGLVVVGSRTAGLEAICEAQTLLRTGRASACLVIGCEVAAPAVPERPEDADLCDGAVALLLESCDPQLTPGRAVLATSASCFPDDPAGAVSAVLAELRDRRPPAAGARWQLLCDAQTRKYVPAELGQVQAVDAPPCGAAAPLAALVELNGYRDGDGEALRVVLAADPSGSAAAVLWRWRSA